MIPETADGFMPCRELVQVLLPAYHPCEHFRGACKSMRWRPEQGHIPRGFCGAVGTVDEVELVLIVAEPGDPHTIEAYDPEASPFDKFSVVCRYVYRCFETGQDQFHRNVRYILDRCWPSTIFQDQMRRVWITESSLCSAEREGGHVPSSVHRQCGSQYLKRELELLSGCTFVALGNKAQMRLKGNRNVLAAASVAPPGCNFKGARDSWDRIARVVRNRSGRQRVHH